MLHASSSAFWNINKQWLSLETDVSFSILFVKFEPRTEGLCFYVNKQDLT